LLEILEMLVSIKIIKLLNLICELIIHVRVVFQDRPKDFKIHQKLLLAPRLSAADYCKTNIDYSHIYI